MKLYGYWRASSPHRVRIALALKGVAVEHVPVNLIKQGGAQHDAAYRALNPSERVPALLLDDGRALTQSLAIIEWLEETYPEPALLPADPVARAQVRAFAMTVACEIQPYQNLATLARLKEQFAADDAGLKAWVAHWIEAGLAALEAGAVARGGAGPFLFGDGPTLAEVFLAPQFNAARRWGADVSRVPRLAAAEEAASALPAFIAAAPENQPDAPQPDP